MHYNKEDCRNQYTGDHILTAIKVIRNSAKEYIYEERYF